jgi:hypothetical protein
VQREIACPILHDTTELCHRQDEERIGILKKIPALTRLKSSKSTHNDGRSRPFTRSSNLAGEGKK